ncbi:hypothetical protein M0208_16690 [Sphingomonas sp. SUN019]|uniref:hypothetical protein n=1 Tax=Sphingomonas sp. SUN019 TaxID=2937788 RepID=UPI0021644C1A|nr:hypothetical protein [Sphingomonas sp. SUN019]UVO52069.1 hypothetical protein M0208_16690 [Sphingomonas sp. SUN019]
MSYGAHKPVRDRAVSAALSIAIVVGLIFVLLTLGASPERRRAAEKILATFDVRPLAKVETRGVKNPRNAKPALQRKETPPPPAAAPPPPRPPPIKPNMLVLTSEEFAAADIGSIPARPADGAGKGAQTADSGSTYGPGDGPGGQRLYNAAWYREPTRAEMVTYLPQRAQVGWGMIACQTIERNRVENCREIGESPGSGIARGLRQAAWQFQVLPPRISGKPVIGAWVRIKFDLVQGVVK